MLELVPDHPKVSNLNITNICVSFFLLLLMYLYLFSSKLHQILPIYLHIDARYIAANRLKTSWPTQKRPSRVPAKASAAASTPTMPTEWPRSDESTSCIRWSGTWGTPTRRRTASCSNGIHERFGSLRFVGLTCIVRIIGINFIYKWAPNLNIPERRVKQRCSAASCNGQNVASVKGSSAPQIPKRSPSQVWQRMRPTGTS